MTAFGEIGTHNAGSRGDRTWGGDGSGDDFAVQADSDIKHKSNKAKL
jgi:hypothetical protein